MIRIVRSSTLAAFHTHAQQAEESVAALTAEADSCRESEADAQAALASYEEERHTAEKRQDALIATMERDLADARADTTYCAAEAAALTATADQLRAERAELRRVLSEIATALVDHKDAEAARREAARLLLRHSDSEDLVRLAEPPRVHLYLRSGVIRSAHATQEQAMRAAEADGADPASWGPVRQANPVADAYRTPAAFNVRSPAVQGWWPDRGRVHLLLLDGRPVACFGTEQAAHAYAATSFAAAAGLTLTVSERAVAPAPSPV